MRPTAPTVLSARVLFGLAGWLGLCYATAAAGAAASVGAPAFYAGLVQPAWAPPAGLFGPVWSVLFTLMAVAAWMVWRLPAGTPGRRRALGVFGVQLVINALWSWLFFVWHSGAGALADVALLAVLIAWTSRAFWRLRPLAGVLLLPYLLWVGFAAVLTAALWRANPAMLG